MHVTSFSMHVCFVAAMLVYYTLYSIYSMGESTVAGREPERARPAAAIRPLLAARNYKLDRQR